MAVDATDLGALEKALNYAAGKASVLWTTFVTFELYLAIAFGAVTHRDLFLETPVKLPILTVLRWLFFVVAPVVFVIFHFYVFIQIYALAKKARGIQHASEAAGSSRCGPAPRPAKTRYVPHLQFLAGPKEQRTHFQGFALRLIAWITLVGAPILILLQAQVTFLSVPPRTGRVGAAGSVGDRPRRDLGVLGSRSGPRRPDPWRRPHAGLEDRWFGADAVRRLVQRFGGDLSGRMG